MNISQKDKYIGVVGENNVETRLFEITDERRFDLDFKLDIDNDGYLDIIDLEKEVYDDKIILKWVIECRHIPNTGLLTSWLRGFNGYETWISLKGCFWVEQGSGVVEAQPEVLPSEFLQIEQRITNAKNDTLATAEEVERDRAEVETNKQFVIEKAEETSRSAAAALTSEQHTKTSEDNAKGYEEEAERQAGIAANNILNGVSIHNSDNASHPSILSDIRTVEAIARGRATAFSFPSIVEVQAWFDGTYIYPDGRTPADLVLGDNIYDETLGVPDYWWNGTQLMTLGAETPDLSAYYTKNEVDNRLPIIIEQTDYDLLVSTGTVIAGRIYYVVPDGTLGV